MSPQRLNLVIVCFLLETEGLDSERSPEGFVLGHFVLEVPDGRGRRFISRILVPGSARD